MTAEKLFWFNLEQKFVVHPRLIINYQASWQVMAVIPAVVVIADIKEEVV